MQNIVLLHGGGDGDSDDSGFDWYDNTGAALGIGQRLRPLLDS